VCNRRYSAEDAVLLGIQCAPSFGASFGDVLIAYGCSSQIRLLRRRWYRACHSIAIAGARTRTRRSSGRRGQRYGQVGQVHSCCANASLQRTNRVVANTSMWTQGRGAVQSSSRMMKGSDLLVVVTNESSVELDIESSSAFAESQDLDVTVRLPPSTSRLPNSQPVPCPSICVGFALRGLHQPYSACFRSYVLPSSP
jgi:hypothetical protein